MGAAHVKQRPHDETWEYISGGWPYDVYRKGTSEKIADVWATNSEDSHGTADLIAQAPAMARLLLKLSEPECPVCGAHDGDPCNELETGHHAFCALGEVLLAAGVLG